MLNKMGSAIALAGLMILSLAGTPPAQADLIGTDFTLDRVVITNFFGTPVTEVKSSASATVQAGVIEFDDDAAFPKWQMDVEASSLSLEYTDWGGIGFAYGEFFEFNGYRFRELDFGPGQYIASVSVSTNYVSAGRVTFTDDTVWIDFTGLSVDPGKYLTVNMTAAPEPASIALLGLGGLALIRRKGK